MDAFIYIFLFVIGTVIVLSVLGTSIENKELTKEEEEAEQKKKELVKDVVETIVISSAISNFRDKR